jgi:flagellar hook-associated protein FlgK
MTAADDALARAEELLSKLNDRSAELERLADEDDIDADSAVDVIAEVAELAKQIEAELAKARALADAAP